MNEEVHAKICYLEHNPTSAYSNIFHKYWTESHYFTGVSSYTYKEEDLPLEELYLEIQLVTFCKEFSYVRGTSRN